MPRQCRSASAVAARLSSNRRSASCVSRASAARRPSSSSTTCATPPSASPCSRLSWARRRTPSSSLTTVGITRCATTRCSGRTRCTTSTATATTTPPSHAPRAARATKRRSASMYAARDSIWDRLPRQLTHPTLLAHRRSRRGQSPRAARLRSTACQFRRRWRSSHKTSVASSSPSPTRSPAPSMRAHRSSRSLRTPAVRVRPITQAAMRERRSAR
jgi:hypothetical protein